MTLKNNILNIDIHSIELKELLKSMQSGVLFTPNVDHLVKLQNNRGFYEDYKKADWVICDSNILNLAAKFLGTPFREVIPGSSFLPAFYEYHKDNEEMKIFLLGGLDGVAHEAKQRINTKLNREIVVGSHSPSFGFENNQEECLDIIKIINDSGASVLVVGVGAPKQERWIIKYRESLPGINIFMALGATIDFEAGKVKRAPPIFQLLNAEWLYRLSKEPRRLWRRYLVDGLPFFLMILKQKRGAYKNPFS